MCITHSPLSLFLYSFLQYHCREYGHPNFWLVDGFYMNRDTRGWQELKLRQLMCYEIMWHCLAFASEVMILVLHCRGGALHPAELKPPPHAPTLSACVSHVIYVNSQSTNLPTFPAWQFVTFPWGLPWRRCVSKRPACAGSPLLQSDSARGFSWPLERDSTEPWRGGWTLDSSSVGLVCLQCHNALCRWEGGSREAHANWKVLTLKCLKSKQKCHSIIGSGKIFTMFIM